MSPVIGDLINGQYRIDQHLGSGGMAEVYLATNVDEGYRYALKFIRDEFLDDPDLIQRFMTEAKNLRNLQHPNIVRFYEFSAALPDYAYIVMEYVPGAALSRLLRQVGRPGQRIPSLDFSMHILAQIAIALSRIHRSNLIHRDVKTGNVLVRTADQRAFLADLGIAKNFQQSMHMTQGIIGTPAYMAPEQHQNRVLTPLTDLYALGVIAFEMLAGRLPFQGEVSDTNGTSSSQVSKISAASVTRKQRVVEQHLMVPPPRASALNPLLPPEIDAVLAQALAKTPDDRPPDTLTLVRSLHEVLRPLLPPHQQEFEAIVQQPNAAATKVGAAPDALSVAPANTPARPPRAPRRRVAIMLAPLIVAILLAAGSLLIVASGDRDQAENGSPSSSVASGSVAVTATRETLPASVPGLPDPTDNPTLAATDMPTTTPTDAPSPTASPSTTGIATETAPAPATPTATASLMPTASATTRPSVISESLSNVIRSPSGTPSPAPMVPTETATPSPEPSPTPPPPTHTPTIQQSPTPLPPKATVPSATPWTALPKPTNTRLPTWTPPPTTTPLPTWTPPVTNTPLPTVTPPPTTTPMPDMRALLADFDLAAATGPTAFNCRLFVATRDSLQALLTNPGAPSNIRVGAQLIDRPNDPVNKIYDEFCHQNATATAISLPSSLNLAFMQMLDELLLVSNVLDG